MFLELINNWVAVGIAVIIAAFSQWRTISTFHLFICSNLASTIPIFNPMGIAVIDPRSNQSLLQIAYFALYGMLRLAISTYLIYRFRSWGNASGHCFVIPHALPHIDVRLPLILGTALRIVWDLSFTMLALRWLIRSILRRREIQGTVQDFLQDQKQKPAWIQMTYIVIACVVNFFFSIYGPIYMERILDHYYRPCESGPRIRGRVYIYFWASWRFGGIRCLILCHG